MKNKRKYAFNAKQIFKNCKNCHEVKNIFMDLWKKFG